MSEKDSEEEISSHKTNFGDKVKYLTEKQIAEISYAGFEQNAGQFFFSSQFRKISVFLPKKVDDCFSCTQACWKQI